MELIPVVQETVRDTVILWDDIPKVYYLLGTACLKSDIAAYQLGPYLYTSDQEETDRLIKWLENRVAQLKLHRLIQGD